MRKELAQFRQILIEHNKGGPDFIPEISNNLGPSETHTLTLEGQNEADKITEELWSSRVKKHVALKLPSILIKGGLRCQGRYSQVKIPHRGNA